MEGGKIVLECECMCVCVVWCGEGVCELCRCMDSTCWRVSDRVGPSSLLTPIRHLKLF